MYNYILHLDLKARRYCHYQKLYETVQVLYFTVPKTLQINLELHFCVLW